MKKSIFWLTAIVFAAALSAAAQVPAPPTDSKVALDTILNGAAERSENYRETFKNLLADELKTFEQFDKRGESDRKTTVKSSFLVYQSGKNAKATAELRNVLEVDGKPIPDSQKRGEEFLAELDKQSTLESELKKLQGESSKYDKTWEVYGLTLNQAVVLAPNLRPAFDFQYAGTETIAGTEVYVVSYRQKTKSPYITVNEGGKFKPTETAVNFNLGIPGDLKKTNLFMRGKLWIDAKTFQIWREERDLVARSEDPVMLVSTLFEYQPSEFGILVPKTISLTIYNAKKEKGDRFNSFKDSNISFEYSKFRQTNVEVKILDDETE
ncbi:MAG TPA: hypothetical protein VIL74_21015 [Pyrinomonadaceae bacterium]|jgi:hypothetical protein